MTRRGTGDPAAEEPVTVWERPERGARGPAPERSRAQIAAAAVELADAEGLVAVSMRQVASKLATGPASLYRYLADRDELLDLMTDAVAGEVDLTIPLSGDPVEDLLVLAVRSKEVHLRHPWLLDIPTEPLRLGPNGLDHLEYALRALAPTALSEQSKLQTIGLLNALVTQFARAELDGRRSPTTRRKAQAAYLIKAAATGRHPLVAQALADQAASDAAPRPQTQFIPLLRRVLVGLTS
ncbi:TetR family transcriptional regulator [Streptomyces viridochromogenes DSM 40736]|uniref:TetR family transcriptional regulator n=1 Tax=Streptomyces viridochromogenes (strain DSM 40736 / JCM 4977 / BCRC 1201 / Tue 494) TaxID=591159 RepID=D9X398_STRVT|nr:TetR/AcrR family transcriptional regulator C-terminal domain-containing protein [Streptomyces viridochromogenes]EFL29614.1 TetR family transcriptional regulator [Streptomyces viridochromogenes DSM 40736]